MVRQWLSISVCLGFAMSSACGGGEGAGGRETRGVWIWGSVVSQQGAEKVADQLAKCHMNLACVLVKGGAGRAGYRSAVALNRTDTGDPLAELIAACRPRGIEVHAWLIFHADREWASAHPEDRLWHQGTPDRGDPAPYEKRADNGEVDGRICPLSPAYREYFLKLVSEIVTTYRVDGIHLDCIRYPHVVYCFCPRHQQKARDLGIDLTEVRKAIGKTLYEPGRDPGYLVSQYKAGSPHLAKWLDMRTEEITTMVSAVRATMATVNPDLALSAAFMPEGAEADDAYAICHYGQSYRTAGALLDFVCPMSYHVGYRRPAEWPGQVALAAEGKAGRAVGVAGIGAFGKGVAGQDVRAAIEGVRRGGAHGFILFRYGTVTPDMWDAVAALCERPAAPFPASR